MPRIRGKGQSEKEEARGLFNFEELCNKGPFLRNQNMGDAGVLASTFWLPSDRNFISLGRPCHHLRNFDLFSNVEASHFNKDIFMVLYCSYMVMI